MFRYGILMLAVCLITSSALPEWVSRKNSHPGMQLTDHQLQVLDSYSDANAFHALLDPIMVRRIPGTPQHAAVKNHIIEALETYGFTVDTEPFVAEVPCVDDFMCGNVRFENIIGTLNPHATRRLVLACHYDSKYFDKHSRFIGMTDSAVPCAMLLEMARIMSDNIKHNQDPQFNDITLQLVFFDGEEAIKQWTSSDSIYGARQLAEKWEKTPTAFNDGTNQLHRVDMLVLLDLIGTKIGCKNCPAFKSYFTDTEGVYNRLVQLENQFDRLGLLQQHNGKMFQSKSSFGGVEDDHIPFLRRGVKILHLIPSPFPRVWHRESDNRSAMDYNTIDNINVILRAFVAEYLHVNI